MLKGILVTIVFTSINILAVEKLSAHEGAGVIHFISQPDHTLTIMATIGLITIAAILFFRKKANK